VLSYLGVARLELAIYLGIELGPKSSLSTNFSTPPSFAVGFVVSLPPFGVFSLFFCPKGKYKTKNRGGCPEGEEGEGFFSIGKKHTYTHTHTHTHKEKQKLGRKIKPVL
jgi:hypothetical protein